MKYCTTEARKVLNKHPDVPVFEVEKALYKARSSQIIRELHKHKDMEKLVAMSMCGYHKFVRDIGEIDWDRIVLHYHYLTERYLKEDFSYSSLPALMDIAEQSFGFIDRHIYRLKVKNLWYLRKVLISEAETAIADEKNYRPVENVLRSTGKGNKIDSGVLNGFVE